MLMAHPPGYGGHGSLYQSHPARPTFEGRPAVNSGAFRPANKQQANDKGFANRSPFVHRTDPTGRNVPNHANPANYQIMPGPQHYTPYSHPTTLSPTFQNVIASWLKAGHRGY